MDLVDHLDVNKNTTTTTTTTTTNRSGVQRHRCGKGVHIYANIKYAVTTVRWESCFSHSERLVTFPLVTS